MAINETKTPLDKDPLGATAPKPTTGGSILRTAILLAVFSFLVGGALSVLGLDPVDFWRGLGSGIRAFVEGILNLGWGAVTTILSYIIFGAMIVLPIWGISKLLAMRKK